MGWNTNVIEEFRANEGKVGGNFEGRTLLLLHTKGRKSGEERINPLAYLRMAIATWSSRPRAATTSTRTGC